MAGCPSVVVPEEHGGGGAASLGPQILSDHPDQSMLRGGVAGEQAAVLLAVGGVVGGLVVGIEVAPVPCGMAIEQRGDLLKRQGGDNGGGGPGTASEAAHALNGGRPLILLAVPAL
jgi:hypothetical protein